MDKTDSLWPLHQKIQESHLIDLTISEYASDIHLGDILPLTEKNIKIQEEKYWGMYIEIPTFKESSQKITTTVSLKELILPLIMIDIYKRVKQNPNYLLLVDDVLACEDQNGDIHKGAFVALRIDWN